MHPYGSIDTTAAWKKLRFILSVRSDFHKIDSLSIAAHAFVSHVSMSKLPVYFKRLLCPPETKAPVLISNPIILMNFLAKNYGASIDQGSYI